jgi:quercetin dioxygenase-like cupin family protein
VRIERQIPGSAGLECNLAEQEDPMSGIINHADQVDSIEVRGERMRPLLTHEMGSPVEVFDNTGPPGAGPAPHHHDWDEIFVVLDGQLEVTVGNDELVRVGPGSAVHVPAGTVHSFRNIGDVHYISLTTRGNAARMFADVAALGPDATTESIRATSRAHGLTPHTEPHPHLRT